MAEQIKNFAMSDMTVASCSSFHKLMVKAMNEATPAALHIEDRMPPYTDSVNTLATVVKRQQAFISTRQLQRADDVRDRAAGLICNVVSAYLSSTIAEKQAAAERLDPQLSPYRGIRKHEYTKETGEIDGMLAQLDLEENQEAIQTLGLTDEVESLRDANEVFNEYIEAKGDESSARSEQRKIESVAAMKRANELFRGIAQWVNAYALIQPSDEINAFVKKVNGLIDVYASVINSSGSQMPTQDSDSEEPTTPEITKFYPKEGANPDRPLEFPRNKTAVLEGKGLKLVDSPEGKKAQLVLFNYVDQRMPHEDSAILLNTDEKIEFTMMYDAAEGQYNFQIETYSNGTEEAVIIKYPETITLV